MLSFLPAPIHGAIIMTLFIINTVCWAIPVYLMIIFKVLTPRGRLRDHLSAATAWLAQHWAVTNTILVRLFMRVEWDLRLNVDISPKGQYLVCANHQTWNDIFVLMHAFGKRAPFFKFFIKQELIWVPILGLAWWGLDYPFMKRYSKEAIAKNPALKGKDLETTRKACEAFKNQPALVLNFLEGTRFTPVKRDQQHSPYRHLLKPKSGGFAFTISALGERLNSLLDVTIVYPDGAKGFWDFCAGRMRKVVVEVRQLEVPREFFYGDYENDAAFRERFQNWIGALWSQKDQRIDQIISGV